MKVTSADYGPVVQSIVSLTKLLRGQLVKCFMTLYPNTLIFFVENMREAFALHTISQQKKLVLRCILDTDVWNFNETLTNNVVSFEQPSPYLLCSKALPFP